MKSKCQLCNGSDFYKLLSVQSANFSTSIKNFDIYRCSHCGLSTMDPMPTPRDIEELYVKEGVFSKPCENPYKQCFLFQTLEPLYKKYGGDYRFIAKTCLRLARKVETLLDIGCGTGDQLRQFLAFRPGIRAVGIDIDPQAYTNADRAVRDNIIIDDFISHEFNQQFDIIVMKLVIEHLLDFRPYMDKIVELLVPRGIFFLSTPDIDSPKARQLLSEWEAINDPRIKIGHIRWFNKRSLHRLADTYALKLLKIQNRGELFYHFPVRLQDFLIAIFGADISERPGRRFIKYYAPRVTYAMLVDGLLSQTIGYGDCIYAFMTKES